MRGRSALLFAGIGLLAAFVALFLLDGCRPASTPERETARAAVTLTSEAVKALDAECAAVVRLTEDRELGERCDDVYVSARAVLVGAAVGVDAWQDTTTRGDVTCVVVNVTRELAMLARELAGKSGRRMLATVEDAARFAALLGTCAAPDGGAR